MKQLIIFILLFGLSGCGFVFQNFNEHEYKNVSRGMPKEEVIRTLGTPQKESMMRIEDTEYEVWEYPKVEPKANQLNSLPTNYYKVFFLDDKVVQWDEDKVFAQPSYKYLETIRPEQKTTLKER
jgi:hypothetical protein